MPDPKAAPMGCRKLVRQFLQDGICEYKDALSKEQVKMCRREVYSMYNETMDHIQRLDLQDTLINTGFTHFKTRHKGRFDMEIQEFENPHFSFLRKDAPWLPLMKALLGDDCRICNAGVMLSMPGSETQPWHSDGDHLSQRKHMPPHCINVFVPLCNITKKNGGTEMVPGTHVLGKYDLDAPSTTILADSGSCIIFDFRLRHRGLGNRSFKPRPVMYITYCIPSWQDTMNFSKRRYLKLPELGSGPHPSGSTASTAAAAADAADATAAGVRERATREFIPVDLDSGDEDEEPEAQPTEKKTTLAKQREERIRFRKLREHAPIVNGIFMFEQAPCLALDNGRWYPARMLQVDEAKQRVTVHYTGWHKRYDFSCDMTSQRIRRCPDGVDFKPGCAVPMSDVPPPQKGRK